jgi:hypothetical protein
MRGNESPVGTEVITQNGYVNVKTEDGWKYKHHILAEKKLGRPLKANERVIIVDGKRDDPRLDDIKVVTKKSNKSQLPALKKRVVKLQAEVTEMLAILDELSDGDS